MIKQLVFPVEKMIAMIQEAPEPKQEIKILAQLSGCKSEEMTEFLKAHGLRNEDIDRKFITKDEAESIERKKQKERYTMPDKLTINARAALLLDMSYGKFMALDERIRSAACEVAAERWNHVRKRITMQSEV